jgi:hypothetical protein
MHEQTVCSMDFLVAESVVDVGLGRCGDYDYWRRSDQVVMPQLLHLVHSNQQEFTKGK